MQFWSGLVHPFRLVFLDASRFYLHGSPYGGFCCRASDFATLIYLVIPFQHLCPSSSPLLVCFHAASHFCSDCFANLIRPSTFNILRVRFLTTLKRLSQVSVLVLLSLWHGSSPLHAIHLVAATTTSSTSSRAGVPSSTQIIGHIYSSTLNI